MRQEGANIVTVMTAIAEKAADGLVSTCGTLVGLGPEYGGAEDSITFCTRLDELVFCCVGCNWWCGQEECNDDTGEWRCDDCTEEDEE